MRATIGGLLLLAAACAARGETVRDVSSGAAPDWTSIATELASRVERDQAMRKELMAADEITSELVHRLSAVDEDNTAWMKALVASSGWPTIARVGEEAAGHAWMLVQHADHDVDFQERCLALVRSAADEGQADLRHLAYLEDRVAMHRGRPQRYGTQYVQKGDDLAPYKLEDPERVDEWRAEVGLGTLAEYEIRLRMQ